MWASAPARTAGDGRAHGPPPQTENFPSALAAMPGIAEQAPLTARGREEALVMAEAGRGIDPHSIAKRFGLPAMVDWRAVDRRVHSGLAAQATHRRQFAGGWCSTGFSPHRARLATEFLRHAL